MEYRQHTIEFDPNTASIAFTQSRIERPQQRLHIPPRQICGNAAGKNPLQRDAMSVVHQQNDIVMWYLWQVTPSTILLPPAAGDAQGFLVDEVAFGFRMAGLETPQLGVEAAARQQFGV